MILKRLLGSKAWYLSIQPYSASLVDVHPPQICHPWGPILMIPSICPMKNCKQETGFSISNNHIKSIKKSIKIKSLLWFWLIPNLQMTTIYYRLPPSQPWLLPWKISPHERGLVRRKSWRPIDLPNKYPNWSKNCRSPSILKLRISISRLFGTRSMSYTLPPVWHFLHLGKHWDICIPYVIQGMDHPPLTLNMSR